MDNNNFGELIKKCRCKKNYSQKELAEILNVTDSAVSKWERGLNYPDIDTIKSLSVAFGVPIDELLFYNCKKSILLEHPLLKKIIIVFIYLLLVVAMLAIILPCIMIARNLLGIIIFISLSFFTSIIIVKVYGNKKLEENVWLFWQLLYSVILILCFFLTRLFNYYVEPYWDNFYNIIPFKTIFELLHMYFISAQEFTFINYYLLNKMYIMIPFPILFGIKFNKKNWFIDIMVLCLLYSFSREIYQYLSGNGVFDIDDIILNLIGCCIGIFICIIYRKINYKLKRREDL